VSVFSSICFDENLDYSIGMNKKARLSKMSVKDMNFLLNLNIFEVDGQ